MISSRSTPTRSRRSGRWAARISSSTTRASRTSTIRRSANTSRDLAETASTSTSPTSVTSMPRWRRSPRRCVCARTCAAATSSRRGSRPAATSTSPTRLFNQLNVDGFFPRVRRRAVGRIRAAAVRAGGQVRRPRPGDHQERRRSSRRTTSSAGSTRRRSSCRSISCA